MIEELIPRVFAARDLAHKLHWASNSYSEHVALSAFYDDVIPAIDAVVESHQGFTGDLVEPDEPYKPEKMDDFAAWLRGESEWIESNRDLISSGHSAIGNLVDNLTAIYLRTAYKLEQLQ